MGKILVTTASGKVGSATMKSLIAKGADAVAALRDPSKSEALGFGNAEAIAFDFSKPETFEAAFEGVDSVFVLPLPSEPNPVAAISPVIEYAKTRVKKIVLMTMFGAGDLPDDNPYRVIEKMVEESGVNYVILRPNWFMQNFQENFIGGILEHNVIALPAGDATVGFIDVRDIGDSVAAALTSDAFNGNAYSLTGPASMHHDEAAKFIAKATGRPVSYVNVSQEEFSGQLRGAGMPDFVVGLMEWLFGSMRNGDNKGLADGVKQLTGNDPRSFETYANDNADHWKA